MGQLNQGQSSLSAWTAEDSRESLGVVDREAALAGAASEAAAASAARAVSCGITWVKCGLPTVLQFVHLQGAVS